MANKELSTIGSKSFEDLKKVNEHGAEYWSARELQPLLGYTQWRRFEDAIKRAITSCEQSGNEPSYHFAGVGKVIRRLISRLFAGCNGPFYGVFKPSPLGIA